MALLGGLHERGGTGRVRRVEVRPVPVQQLERVQVPSQGRQEQRRGPALVLRVGAGAFGDQALHGPELVALRGLGERVVLQGIPLAMRKAALYTPFGDLAFPVRSSFLGSSQQALAESRVVNSCRPTPAQKAAPEQAARKGLAQP